MPTDKIGELMNVLSGGIFTAADGSWYNFCTYVSDRCDASLDSLYDDLMNSPVLYSDATYTRENGEETYVRNVSNKNTVIYSPQDDKTIEEIGKTPVFSDFFGILMTDHETAMKHFGSDNAECNQHTDRYCAKTSQETSHCWSEKFMGLLYEIKEHKERLISQGIDHFLSVEHPLFIRGLAGSKPLKGTEKVIKNLYCLFIKVLWADQGKDPSECIMARITTVFK